MLLAHGAEVDSPLGWALQTAAAQGHLGVVRILLENGANVNACIGEDHFPQGTALQAACEAGLRDIVKLLLEYHADPDLGAGPLTCPIIAAASQGENDILNQLVEAGAKLDILGGPNERSPLVLAAAKLPVESVQKLLDAGATVDFETGDGDTALLVAAAVGDADCVQLLLNRGADILHVNAEGYNTLQAALGDGGDAACLRLIIWRVSAALLAVKTAVNEGNNELANLIREAAEKPVSGELDENSIQEDGSQESETSSPDKDATDQEGSQVDVNESIAPPDVPDEGTTSEPPPHDEEIPPSSRLVDQEEVAHPATDSEDEPYNETVLPLRPRGSMDSDIQN
jgi:ankyrin repeat protein